MRLFRPLNVWVVAITVIAMSPPLTAQNPMPKLLLAPVDMGETKLDAKQLRIRGRIQDAASTVGEVKIVKWQDEAPRDKASVILILPDGGKLEMADYTFTKRDKSSVFAWKCEGQMVNLTVSGSNVTGMIYADKKVFSVEPLGKGLLAVSQVDQSKMKDHPFK